MKLFWLWFDRILYGLMSLVLLFLAMNYFVAFAGWWTVPLVTPAEVFVLCVIGFNANIRRFSDTFKKD
jgi:hypothetical protein